MAPFAQEAIASGADLLISDAAGDITNFEDVACIVNQLDAVVTVDTAMVHLAGAMGKRCFMLNPRNACWRWCRGAAPWYSSVEMFHQATDLSWTTAIQAIKGELAEMIK
jgi:ADP-heptose:LPS heptosyltransferase